MMYRGDGRTAAVTGCGVMDVAPHHHQVVVRQKIARGKIDAPKFSVEFERDVCVIGPLCASQLGAIKTLRRDSEVSVANLLDLA